MKLGNMFLGLSVALATLVASVSAEAQISTKGLAVVLIDMQYGFYERGGVTGTPGLEALVAKQITLLDWAVAENVPVIVFEFDGYRATDTRLMDRLKGHTFEVITKQYDDGFGGDPSKPLALKALVGWNVDTLLIAGINGCCCVQGTAMGGIANGFDIVTSSDVVGNINYNPPTYPNNTWYFKDKKFTAYGNLDEMIGPAAPAPATTWPRRIMAEGEAFHPFGTEPFARVN